jgi:hypothetical protein
MGDITVFDDTSKTAGKVVAVNSGATGYELITAPTASPGVVVTADALDGDGSVGSPLALLLDGGADSGLTQSPAGLKIIGSGPGIAYTPTWTASVSNPSVGDGTLLGRFVRMMNLCFLNIDLTIGASTGRGSGAWNFALPTGCDALTGVQQTIPLAITTPSGGGMSGHAILLGGTATLNLYIGGATSSKITNSNPSSLPAGSRLSITGFYEVDA